MPSNESASTATTVTSTIGTTSHGLQMIPSSTGEGVWEQQTRAPTKVSYVSKMNTLIVMKLAQEWASPFLLIGKVILLPMLLIGLIYTSTVIDRSYSKIDTVIQPQPKLPTCRKGVERNCVDLTFVSNLDKLHDFPEFISRNENMSNPTIEYIPTTQDLYDTILKKPKILRKNIFGIGKNKDTLEVTIFSSGGNDMYNSWDYTSPSCGVALQNRQFCMWEKNYPILYEHLLSYLADKYLDVDLQISVDVSGYPAKKSWFTKGYIKGVAILVSGVMGGVPSIIVAIMLISISNETESGRTVFLNILGISNFKQFGIEYLILMVEVQIAIIIMVGLSAAMHMDIFKYLDFFSFWWINMLNGFYIIGLSLCFRPLLKKRISGIIIGICIVLIPLLISQVTVSAGLVLYSNYSFGSFVDIIINLLPGLPFSMIFTELLQTTKTFKLSFSDLYKGTDNFDKRSVFYLIVYTVLFTFIAVMIHAIKEIKIKVKNSHMEKETGNKYSNDTAQGEPNINTLDNFVEFRNVTFSYKNKRKCKGNNKSQGPIFKDVNVSINNVTALIGRSGAGKSTFFNLILGILRPTKGAVRVLGKPPELIRTNIGVVFQHSQLFPDLTVKQHIKLLGGLKVGKVTDEDVITILKRVLLDETCLNMKPKNMSGGMQRRLCIALAILGDIKFLLLDEPTTGLDPITQLEIWNMLHVLNQHIPIIFSTHMLSEISTLDSDILFVADKTVSGNGSLSNILERGVCVACRDKSMIKIDETQIFNTNNKLETDDMESGTNVHSIGEDEMLEAYNASTQYSGSEVLHSKKEVDDSSESGSATSSESKISDTPSKSSGSDIRENIATVNNAYPIEIKEFDEHFLVFSRYAPINLKAISVHDPNESVEENEIEIRQWNVEEAVTVFSGYDKINYNEEDDSEPSHEKRNKKSRHMNDKEDAVDVKQIDNNEIVISASISTTTDMSSEEIETSSSRLSAESSSDISEEKQQDDNLNLGNNNDKVYDVEELHNLGKKNISSRKYRCLYCLTVTKSYLGVVGKSAKRSPGLIVFMILAPAMLIFFLTQLLKLTSKSILVGGLQHMFTISIDEAMNNILKTDIPLSSLVDNTSSTAESDTDEFIKDISNSRCIIGAPSSEVLENFCSNDDPISSIISSYLGIQMDCVIAKDLHAFNQNLYDYYEEYIKLKKAYDKNPTGQKPKTPILGIYYSNYSYTTKKDPTNNTGKDIMKTKINFIPQIFQNDEEIKYVLHTLWGLQMLKALFVNGALHSIDDIISDVGTLKTMADDSEGINNISFNISYGNQAKIPTIDSMGIYIMWQNLQLPVISFWAATRRSRYHLIERLSGGYSKQRRKGKAGIKNLDVIIDICILFLYSFIESLISLGFYEIARIDSVEENTFWVYCIMSLIIASYISLVGLAIAFLFKSIVIDIVIGLAVIVIFLSVGFAQMPYGEYFSTTEHKLSLIIFPEVLLGMSRTLSLGGTNRIMRKTAPRITKQDLMGIRVAGDNPNIEYIRNYTQNTIAFLNFLLIALANAVVWLLIILLRRLPFKIIEHYRFKKRLQHANEQSPYNEEVKNTSIGVVIQEEEGNEENEEEEADESDAITSNNVTKSESTESDRLKLRESREESNYNYNNDDENYIIRAQNLVKKFGKRTVLYSINLDIKEGDRISILGTSGSGKTTFLNCLTGKYTSYTGTIRYNKQDDIQFNKRIMTSSELMSVTSLCEQGENLFDFLTVFEHIMFALKIQFSLTLVSNKNIRQMARHILYSVRLSDVHFNKLPKELSGGMRRRLSIAMALAARREVTILDEPTTGLDMATKLQVTQALLDIHEADPAQTLILTTHDMDVAERFSNRIVILDRGYIKLDDSVEHIRATAPTLVKATVAKHYTGLLTMLEEHCITYEEIMFGASKCISTQDTLPQELREAVERDHGLILMEPSIHTAFAKAVFVAQTP